MELRRNGTSGFAARKAGWAAMAFVALLVACGLTFATAHARPAYAATLGAGVVQLAGGEGNAQAIKKAAVKGAKNIIKKAKATKGSARSKLKKIYTRIARDSSNRGIYQFGNYHGDFYFKALDTDDAAFYPATPPKNMKNYYLKYAADAYKTKKASCYHYAALFAVCAKQALGEDATVKIAVGSTNVTGEMNPHHAWAEVKIGAKTYVYDPMNGNYWSLNESYKATGFGKFCGTQRSKMKSFYKKFKGAKYAVVKL